MAVMTTALTEFADNGNSRTYTQVDHTAAEPRLVIQKRKIPSGSQVILEDTISVVESTEDAAGTILPQRVAFVVTVKRPINGIAADVTSALATFRDIVAGDEFTNVVNTQEFLV